MDQKTITFYNTHAQAISNRLALTPPADLYPLITNFFTKGQPTLDLGCGSGRDTAWLNQQGYPTIGLDASEGMLPEAKTRYPQNDFRLGTLPDLKEVNETFTNVFCSAVLMHIPRALLLAAVNRLLTLTKTNGRILVSYRGPDGPDERLFETYHPGQLALLFEGLGGRVLYTGTQGVWHTLIIEKHDLNQREGIALIQDIIHRDRKTATYKFALLRALCEIARYEPNLAVWNRDADQVLIPMKRIAIRWMGYYLPLVKTELKQTTSGSLAFEELLRYYPFKSLDAPLLVLEASRTVPEGDIKKLLTKIKHTIKVRPVVYLRR